MLKEISVQFTILLTEHFDSVCSASSWTLDIFMNFLTAPFLPQTPTSQTSRLLKKVLKPLGIWELEWEGEIWEAKKKQTKLVV